MVELAVLKIGELSPPVDEGADDPIPVTEEEPELGDADAVVVRD